MDRRQFLLLGATTLGLTGCTFGDSAPTDPTAPPGSSRDPDTAIRASVAASELALIASYSAAIEAAPELAADLEPLRAHHEAHLARISPETRPTPVLSPGSDAGTSQAAAVAALADAESDAQDQRTSACAVAQDPGLARDLCLVAASEAQHAAVLTQLARSLDT